MLRKDFPNIRYSNVYASAPMERTDQSSFLNASATFETNASPESVKLTLETIEKALGKSPPFRFGPRTIDLDILLFGDLILPSINEWPENQKLSVPHPKLHLRRFVLDPLLELIDPATIHPALGKPLSAFFNATLDQACARTTIVL